MAALPLLLLTNSTTPTLLWSCSLRQWTWASFRVAKETTTTTTNTIPNSQCPNNSKRFEAHWAQKTWHRQQIWCCWGWGWEWEKEKERARALQRHRCHETSAFPALDWCSHFPVEKGIPALPLPQLGLTCLSIPLSFSFCLASRKAFHHYRALATMQLRLPMQHSSSSSWSSW